MRNDVRGRTLLTLLVLVAGCLGLAPAAFASTATVTGAAGIKMATYTASAGEANDVDVVFSGTSTNGQYTFTESASGPNITPGPGCSQVGANLKKVFCTITGDATPEATLNLGDQADTLRFANGGSKYIVYGGADSDTLTTGSVIDEINGDAGDDTIDGLGGTNTISGGDGNDQITSGAGGDTLEGNADNDTIYAGSGNDTLRGGTGLDQIFGQDGNDTFDAGAADDGTDYYYGDTTGAGTSVGTTDIVDYSARTTPVRIALDNGGNGGGSAGAPLDGSENDYVNEIESARGGSAGDDIQGNTAVNDLRGNNGGDKIAGADGDDDLQGNDGADTLIGGGGDDSLLGSTGTDTIDYQPTHCSVTVDLSQATGQGSLGSTETVGDDISLIENVRGSNCADVLTGSGGPNVIEGAYGDDDLDGAGGADTVRGQEGSDTLDGGTAADVLAGGSELDLVTYETRTANVTADADGASGDDGEASEGDSIATDVENLRGGTGNDTLGGNADANTLEGGDGGDTLRGLGGTDTLRGQADGDTLEGGTEADTLWGSAGNDILRGGADNDFMGGGADDDTFDAGTAKDGADGLYADYDESGTFEPGTDVLDYSGRTNPVLLNLGGGNSGEGDPGNPLNASENDYTDANHENARGGAGADLIIGNAQGNDLDGNGGADELESGTGEDVLHGDAGRDVLEGGTGDDQLNGGTEDDLADYRDTHCTVEVDLSQTTGQGGPGDEETAGDTYSSIQDARGSNCADVLRGDGNPNELDGEYGDDTLDGRLGADVMRGGEGTDTVDYSTRSAAITADLDGASADDGQGGATEGDTLATDIEDLKGGTVGDVLKGNDSNNRIDGGTGADSIDGLDGADNLRGDAGNDTIDPGLGNFDNSYGGDDDDTFKDGNETGATNFDYYWGMEGDDTFLMGTAADANDQFYGDYDPFTGVPGSGTDTVDYSGRTNAVAVYLNNSSNSGEAGEFDYLYTDMEHAIGGPAGDTLVGNELGNTLDGNGGNDAFRAGPGADVIDGEGGDDTLDGGPGDDDLNGGTGTDTVDYDSHGGCGVIADLSTTVLEGDQTLCFYETAGDTTDGSIENARGSDGNDQLTGSGGVNRLEGEHGDDQLRAGGGNDVLDGGHANDTIDGEANNDVILASSGTDSDESDTVIGGTGTDTADYSGRSYNQLIDISTAGGDGSDYDSNGTADENDDVQSSVEVLLGGTGNDRLTGASTVPAGSFVSNRLEGGPGTDELYGLAGNDTMIGGPGDDTLDGGTGTADVADYGARTEALAVSMDNAPNDGSDSNGDGNAEEGDTVLSSTENVLSGSGNDRLVGADGVVNRLEGAGGNDTLDGRTGNDVLDGGTGRDVGDYSPRTSPVVATLDGNANDGQTSLSEADNLTAIEDLEGGTAADTLTGDSDVNRISGNNGDDILDGGDGPDVIDGDSGTDTVDYSSRSSAVRVTLAGGANDGTIVGGEGDDVRTTERARGGGGSDELTGTTGVNRLEGNGGDDALDGLAGADSLIGNDGVDLVDYSSRSDRVVADIDGAADDGTDANGDGTSEENDTISLSVENVTGGAGNDSLVGSSSPNRLAGSGGDDRLDGGTGADEMDGGPGDDTADYSSRGARVAVDPDDQPDDGSDANANDIGEEGDNVSATTERINGGGGNDLLKGAPSVSNVLNGNNGNDELRVRDNGPDTANCGAGIDRAVLDSSDTANLDCESRALPSTVLVAAGTLTFQAGANSTNDVTITQNTSTITVEDTGSSLTAGPGCTQVSDTQASCTRAGVTLVRANAGDQNDEVVFIGSIRNELNGESEDDRLTSGTGANDLVDGGEGNDLLDTGTGADTARGGNGTDTVTYSTRTNRIRVSLDGVANDGADTNGDGVTDENDQVESTVESVVGGSNNDTLVGNDEVNNLNGGPTGNDFLEGRGGADVLDAGTGTSDTVSYGERTAGVVVDLDNVADDGTDANGDGVSEENDHVVQAENVVGGSGNDKMTGNSIANRFDGNGGNDTMVGDLGGDRLDGGAGNDSMDGGLGADQIIGGDDVDSTSYAVRTIRVVITLDGSANDGQDGNANGVAEEGDNVSPTVENVTGGSNIDTITGSAGDNTLTGGNGSDVLDGAGGADNLVGGDGGGDTVTYASRSANVVADIDGNADDGTDANGDGVAEEGDNVDSTVEKVTGGSGNDTLTGSASSNTLAGGGGNDLLEGGSGRDVMAGDGGTDTVTYATRTTRQAVTLDGVANDGSDSNGDGTAEEQDDVQTTVENVIGGSAADRLTGRTGATNLLDGAGGDDRIEVRNNPAEADQVTCGSGLDTAIVDALDTFTVLPDCEDRQVG